MFCDLSGPTDSRETCAMFRRMAVDSCLGKGWGILVDARETEGTPTVHDIDLLVQTLDDVKDELTGRIAFVTGMWAPFGMARMLEIRAALVGLPFRAFMYETEAREWLAQETAG